MNVTVTPPSMVPVLDVTVILIYVTQGEQWRPLTVDDSSFHSLLLQLQAGLSLVNSINYFTDITWISF